MNEEQIRALIEDIYTHCKNDYEQADAKLAETPFDHPDRQLEYYMRGYAKGRLSVIEHIKNLVGLHHD